jgi:hypothetical protein
MRLWVRWSAWFCVSLMLWAAAAESTHNHPTRTESASCSICVAAQSASPTLGSGQTAPVFASIGLLQEEDVTAEAWLEFSERGVRGPPVL